MTEKNPTDWARQQRQHADSCDAFSDSPLLIEARRLWSCGSVDAALKAFESARQSGPGNIRARVEFARALAQVYEIRAAEQLLDEARAIAGDKLPLLAAIAPVYRQIYRPHIARDLMEDLWRRDALPPPALVELALTYERFGQMVEAVEAINQVVVQAPDQLEPKLLQARLARQLGDTELATRNLRELVSNPALPPVLLSQAWAELGQVFDLRGDFESAIKAFTESKAAAAQLPEVSHLRNHSAALQHTFVRLYDSLQASHISDWRTANLPPLEGFAGFVQLIGFPRSGTTLLEQILAAHPSIFVSSERALFSSYIFPAACRASGNGPLTLDSLLNIPRSQLIRSRERYAACTQAIEGDRIGGRIHLDKNPNHTSLAAGLLRLFPESKFLFAIRDPRDVVVSTYLRYFPLSEFSVNFLRLEDLVELYLAEMRIWQRFRASIGGQWIEVRYEDLVTDFRKEVHKTLDFIDLDWTGDVENYYVGLQQKHVNSPSHDVVRRPIYSTAVGRWQHYQKLLAPVWPRLEPLAKLLGYE
jgi:tetratricopeptide (TPR) repeat protein